MQLVWVESRRKTISSGALKAQKFWSTIQGLCHCSWWLCRYHLIISFRRSPVHCTFVYRCTLQHTPHLIIGKNQQEMLNWRIITQGFWLSGTKTNSLGLMHLLLTSMECNRLALHCMATGCTHILRPLEWQYEGQLWGGEWWMRLMPKMQFYWIGTTTSITALQTYISPFSDSTKMLSMSNSLPRSAAAGVWCVARGYELGIG